MYNQESRWAIVPAKGSAKPCTPVQFWPWPPSTNPTDIDGSRISSILARSESGESGESGESTADTKAVTDAPSRRARRRLANPPAWVAAIAACRRRAAAPLEPAPDTAADTAERAP